MLVWSSCKIGLDVGLSWSTGGVRVDGYYECYDSRQILLRSISILQSTFLNGEQHAVPLSLPFMSQQVCDDAAMTSYNNLMLVQYSDPILTCTVSCRGETWLCLFTWIV